MYVQLLAQETGISAKQVAATLALLDEGATIPFISRYRKELTGSLDEVQIGTLKERYEKLQEIQKRRESILKSIAEQDLLSDDLKARIEATWNATELEDLYLPYKPKRKTRAVKARELGLEPLAEVLWQQHERDVETRATAFLSDEVPDVEAALQGARDILAERINEDLKAREVVRREFQHAAVISSRVVKGKEEEAAKYRDYFDFSEPLKRCPSHRLLAMRRAEKEGFLKISVAPEAEPVVERLSRTFVKGRGASSEQVQLAVEDAYKRLLAPSIENEVGALAREKAEEQAIQVFATNLRQLLLSSPLGQKRVLAIDPGFRTGCKVVCLDAQGALLHNETIYPHPPQNDTRSAYKKIDSLVEQYKIEAIAIGNGTASRETEAFIRNMRFNRELQVFVVSEDGASVYSASKTARKEFPDYDVTVRGAVSIGRRLMDPLAELVKIDPKSIGVGQYQHEVDQKLLKESLDDVVISCVNEVGVNLNTASQPLLTSVSGLGPQLAKNIVEYRSANGPLDRKSELKKVKRLGEKAFEQCAGFLRILDGKNPLDNSAVHPESYTAIEKMAKQLKMSVTDLIGNAEVLDQLKQVDFPYIDGFTFKDIIKELKKPGRDPRKKVKVLEFDSTVKTIDDLSVGKKLNGMVTNITNFGAFINIGIKENGLIHKSNLANTYVENPADYIKLHEHVTVEVIQLDVARKRIGLKRVE